RRLDVVVEVEDVGRVVGLLERGEAGVGRLAVGRVRGVVVAEEVHVGAAGRGVAGGGDRGAGPVAVRVGRGRVVIAGDGVEHVGHRPLGERGGVVGHACDGAAHLVDVDLALGAGGGEVDRAEPVD